MAHQLEQVLEQALPLASFADHLGLMNARGLMVSHTGNPGELLEA